MGLFHKYGTRTNEVQRAKREFALKAGLVLAVLLLFAGIVILARWGRKSADAKAGQDPAPAVRVDLEPLRQEVAALRAEFAAAQAAGEIQPAQVDLLDRAIAVQSRVIGGAKSDLAPLADTRTLEDLQRQRDGIRGEWLYEESRQAQTVASRALESGDLTVAEEGLKKAVQTQQEINKHFPLSPRRSTSRQQVLESELAELRVRPDHVRSLELERTAEAEIQEGKPAPAVEHLRAALELQSNINKNHKETRFVSFSRAQLLERRVVEAEALAGRTAIDEALAAATAAEAKGEHEEVLRQLTRAQALQQSLNQRFPGTAATAPERQQAIVARVEAAQSREQLTSIRSQALSLRLALRGGKTDRARELLSNLLRDGRALREAYPMVGRELDPLMEEVRYLFDLRDDLAVIHQAVQARLLPVPGLAGVRLLREEVSQVLYQQVMETNPSGQQGSQLPVESLTWDEAKEFSRRLGWILGQPVRLPRLAEVQAAFGEAGSLPLSRITWNSQNTDRTIRAVGTSQAGAHGFFDLTGNVAEWSEDSLPGSAADALVLGGSVRDNPGRLQRVVEESRPKLDRNRFVGFRVAVAAAD